MTELGEILDELDRQILSILSDIPTATPDVTNKLPEQVAESIPTWDKTQYVRQRLHHLRNMGYVTSVRKGKTSTGPLFWVKGSELSEEARRDIALENKIKKIVERATKLEEERIAEKLCSKVENDIQSRISIILNKQASEAVQNAMRKVTDLQRLTELAGMFRNKITALCMRYPKLADELGVAVDGIPTMFEIPKELVIESKQPQRANRSHLCSRCGKTIRKGEKYFVCSIKESYIPHKICQRCIKCIGGIQCP